MFVTATGMGSQRARCLSYQARARHFSLAASALAALFLSMIPQSARSAPMNYGSHTGTTVEYIDVSEEATTADSVPLFGAPVFSADSIDFNPIGFDATASGQGGTDTTGSRLTFMVAALTDNAINNINFHEAGQTGLSGSGTDSTSTEVTASGTVTISHVDGTALGTPVVRPIALAFTPSGGDFGLVADGGGLPFYHTAWTGSLALNVAQILTQESVPFSLGATKISIDLVNTLSADSEVGTYAQISKQDFGGISITVNVRGGGGPDIPEPATLALAGVGLLGLLGGRQLRPKS